MGRFGSRREVLPGFGLTLGLSLLYLCLIVLIPLSAAFTRAAGLGWARFWTVVTAPRVVASYKISFGISLGAALINLMFGLLVAWVLVRYRFPGKRLIDGIVDLPFALPTAVAGIALTQVYAPTGWLGEPLLHPMQTLLTWLNLKEAPKGRLGEWLMQLEIHTAYSQLGILIAMVFIGIPFVVRTVQPVLEDLDAQFEEAARSLGASPLQTFRRVIFPEMLPALLTGFALAFARALGEYGSVVFISGNLPFRTEIVPLLIITKLDQYDYRGATAIAVVMLVASFVLLLVINLLQRWAARYHEA